MQQLIFAVSTVTGHTVTLFLEHLFQNCIPPFLMNYLKGNMSVSYCPSTWLPAPCAFLAKLM